MITKRERYLSRAMIFTQVGLTIGLFLFIESLFPLLAFSLKEHIFLLAELVVIWSVLFAKFHLGVVFRDNSLFNMVRGYAATIFFGCTIFLIELKFIPFVRPIPYSLKFLLLFAITDLVILVSFKVLFYHIMHYMRRKGYNCRKVIFIADSEAIPVIDLFKGAKDWGYTIDTVISSDSDIMDKYDKVLSVQSQEELKDYFTKNPIDDVFYCLPVEDSRYDLDLLIKQIEEIGISLHIMQPEFLSDIEYKSKNNVPVFEKGFVSHNIAQHGYLSIKIKDIFDIIISSLALLMLSPLMFLIALLIWLEDRGPVLFKQERIGLNGRRFICLKFRSMVMNAEDMILQLQDLNESDGPTFKIENDPRITKIGRLIRKTSLDELPQFYNVIKGEMSVVGPRPPLLKEVQQYKRAQLRRLSMKPGLTCIWQVWGRNEVSFEEWMRMDLEYIDKWSIWLDIKIIFATIGVVLKANGR